MRGCDKQVTIFHSEWDAEKGVDTLKRNVVNGVSFYGRTNTNVDKDGLHAAMEAVMRIPEDAIVTSGINSPARDVKVYPGDLVLCGRVPVNFPESGVTPDALKEMIREDERDWYFRYQIAAFKSGKPRSKYSIASYIWTVVAVTENYTVRNPHIKVVMK